jgi:hypothetical protein
MYKICRIAAGALCLIWVAAASADDAVAGPECSANVCVVNVIAKNLVTAPCTGYSVLVAYSTISGATMIQCTAATNAEDNRAFVYDRFHAEGKTFEFQGGKFIRPNAWEKVQSEGIRDRFASSPLCPGKKREEPVAGTLLIVEKHPSDSEEHPYCYGVNYVVAEGSVVTLRSDDGKELTPLLEKESERWAALERKLSPYVAGGDSSQKGKQQKTASVKSERASLYSAPNAADASKMYLVQGDRVQVIDDSKLGDGWCLIRYVTKTGKTIEKWAQAQDLELQDK